MLEIAGHLAVAGGIYDRDFLAILFPTRCLGWDLGLNWVSLRVVLPTLLRLVQINLNVLRSNYLINV